MPESAEVRRLVDRLAGLSNHTVTETSIKSGRYTRTPIAGFKSLAGYTLKAVGCKGKLLILIFNHSNGMSPDIHALATLGMTGWWHVSDGSVILPQNSAPEEVGDFSEKHERLRIHFGKWSAIFTDPRNFGTFKLTTKAGLLKKCDELGPDIARHELIPGEFWLRLQRFGKKKTIAEVMLDQRIFCGVGNYMRADAMYHAGIDPRTPALDVSKRQLGQLWNSAHLVANAAFQDKSIGKPDRFFYNLCYGRKTDDFGNPIESYEDRNGRTVWWCPTTQESYKQPT